MTVAIVAAAGVSPIGGGWRGLAERARATAATPTRPVADAALVAVPVRARKTMSRGALLAAAAMHELVAALPAEALRAAGCFVGVGASGGSTAELHAMLRASMDGATWSLARFGGPGLAACNPLLAFQLMNNFTMAHAAIQEGVGAGVHGALFSRGAGTVHALIEAVAAIEDDDAPIAIAGGADSALHPVTWAELERCHGGWSGVPGEGAALVAVARGEGLARVIRAEVCAAEDRAALTLPDRATAIVALTDAALAAQLADRADVLDLGPALGECLAAGPALAWLAALDLLAAGAPRVAVVTADVDGAVGVVELERGS
ncbi:MAG: hypothetical protein IPL61_29815 [Myxococcales bacterium]|nr:hypothetical protein [Myxococcales bacterium]